MSDYFDTAQICINGHVITSMLDSSPESNQKFCSTCGAPTIHACPNCMTAIRGYLHMSGVVSFAPYNKPSYCYNCGQALPWTAASLEAAAQVADDLDNLSDTEKEELKRTFPDLVRETPKTPLAQSKFKALMKKAGKEGYEVMKKVLTDVVVEATKKGIFGP